MGTEVERLRRLYGELGDDDLLDLAEEREDLKAEAQLALSEELRRRKLDLPPEESTPGYEEGMRTTHNEARSYGSGSEIPGIIPGSAPDGVQGLGPGGQNGSGMVRFIQFYDGHALSKACEVLDDAGIAPAVEEIEGDAAAGVPSSFQVWVDAADEEEGKTVLRARLGLFPLREADDISDVEAVGEVTGGDLGDFETPEEAEQICALLIQEGIHATLETTAQEDEEEIAWTTVRVDPKERAAAIRLLEERISQESGG